MRCFVCKSSKGKLSSYGKDAWAHPICAYRVAGIEKGEIIRKSTRQKKMKNPPAHILGDVIEIRYRRTTGKHRGSFKHVFKTGGKLVAGYDKDGRKIIVVKPK